METLNFQQKLAAQAPQKPLLIVAGAGTGKTRTLTSRLLHVIDQGVPPEKIYAITFTNKAAREMANRLQTKLSRDRSRRPFIGTFHSLGASILRRESRAFGRTASFTIFDNNDSLELIKKLAKSTPESHLSTPSVLMRSISNIKNGMVDKAALHLSTRKQERVLLAFFERYEDALKQNNAFDFDDLIEKPALLLKQNPERRAWYVRHTAHLLVDEYQDINNVQYELIRLLVGSGGALSVVGDDQQTIYSWRGSNYEIFLNFERDWPDANVIFLEENYRSSGTIITAASTLIAHNQRQRQKTLWTKNPQGVPVTITEARDENQEAAWIAETLIASFSKDGAPASHAILYRTNAQSRALEQALIGTGIPYELYGGLAFYERREIKDIIAALRFASNPKDDISLDRLKKTFTKRVFVTLHELLLHPPSSAPHELIHHILEHTRYFAYLEKHFTNADERKENILELVRYAGEFTELAPLLEQVSLLQSTDRASLRRSDGAAAGYPTVILTTIHLAKGLEFDHVFIAGCTEGLLPHERSLESEVGLEEERRLFYVAMTRARESLKMSFYDIPSRFLGELPAELTEFQSLLSETTPRDEDEERYVVLD